MAGRPDTVRISKDDNPWFPAIDGEWPIDAAEQAGWTPVCAHISDAAEWDSYEWSWIGSLAE